jgi:hypothetical protein
MRANVPCMPRLRDTIHLLVRVLAGTAVVLAGTAVTLAGIIYPVLTAAGAGSTQMCCG